MLQKGKVPAAYHNRSASSRVRWLPRAAGSSGEARQSKGVDPPPPGSEAEQGSPSAAATDEAEVDLELDDGELKDALQIEAPLCHGAPPTPPDRGRAAPATGSTPGGAGGGRKPSRRRLPLLDVGSRPTVEAGC
jgi:hypothetical protein